METFRPESLQRPGQTVLLTASRDVTELRDRTRAMLLHSAELLVPVFLVGLAIALALARRIGEGVRAISEAAGAIKGGKYVTVPEPQTRTSSASSHSTSTRW